ncbi:MAG: acyl carrier protein [Lentimonas sp.]|jgi:acyl carrier protein
MLNFPVDIQEGTIEPMSLKKFINIFEGAVEGVESGALSASTQYKALKVWDSLAILTVTDAIEMEYGILPNKKHFEGAETIEELYQSILPDAKSTSA